MERKEQMKDSSGLSSNISIKSINLNKQYLRVKVDHIKFEKENENIALAETELRKMHQDILDSQRRTSQPNTA